MPGCKLRSKKYPVPEIGAAIPPEAVRVGIVTKTHLKATNWDKNDLNRLHRGPAVQKPLSLPLTACTIESNLIQMHLSAYQFVGFQSRITSATQPMVARCRCGLRVAFLERKQR